MHHLTTDEVERLRNGLVAERDRLRIRLSGEVAQVRSVEQLVETQDAAADEARRGTNAALADRDRARLDAVDAALTRMKDGSYGVCEETDDPIPFARLELEPTTRLGVEAMEALEAEGIRGPADRPEGPY